LLHKGLPVTPVARTLLDFAAVAPLERVRKAVAEADFLKLLDLCRRHRLPFPEVNVKLGPHTVDALWRAERVIVEVDGGDGHSSYAQMQRDRQRDLYLRQRGYSVLRYTWRQVTGRRADVAADVRRAVRVSGRRFKSAA
jgi:very-short-patch-repair endonuclease